MQHFVYLGAFHGGGARIAQRANARFKQILKERADNFKRQEENRQHDQDKCGNSRKASRKNAIRLLAARVFAAFMRLYHGQAADALDEGKTHAGQRRRAIKVALSLHLQRKVLDGFQLVFVQIQRTRHQRVAFCQLRCGKTHRNARFLGVIFNQVHNAVKAPMHRTAVFRSVAEVLALGTFAVIRNVHGVVHQLGNAFALHGANGHNGNAQLRFQFVDQHRSTVRGHFVHHVQRQNHRNVQLKELHGQIQIALDIRGVHNIDDTARFILQHELARNNLFCGIRTHGIDAWQVRDQGVCMAQQRAVLAVNRNSGEVAHVLVGARELVEQRCFAAVLVSYQGKCQFLILGKRRFLGCVVVAAAFAKARVIGFMRMPAREHTALLRLPRVSLGVANARNLFVHHIAQRDARRILQAQRKLVTVNAHLNRVAHGGMLHHGHVRARD